METLRGAALLADAKQKLVRGVIAVPAADLQFPISVSVVGPCAAKSVAAQVIPASQVQRQRHLTKVPEKGDEVWIPCIESHATYVFV